jgi:RHS repeat-associated protein
MKSSKLARLALGAGLALQLLCLGPGSVQAQTLYFIQADHLNTPRLIANSTGTTVWRWDQGEPFGNDVPNENPSGLGTLVVPLRFPGQYFDRETNLAYNVMRDFDPGIGRYVESDPIGLRGGVNTYAYVGGNPLSFVDAIGLAPAPRRPPRTPIIICPPAPPGTTMLEPDWGLISKQRCFYMYDPETGGPRLECFGRGPGEGGMFGWDCAAECKYQIDCTKKVIRIPGKCTISPFDFST